MLAGLDISQVPFLRVYGAEIHKIAKEKNELVQHQAIFT